MKTFKSLRESLDRKPSGKKVFDQKMGSSKVAIHKEVSGYVVYIDGDRLDDYDDLNAAKKAASEFVKMNEEVEQVDEVVIVAAAAAAARKKALLAKKRKEALLKQQQKPTNEEKLDEDWGSSDWTAALRSMKRSLGGKTDPKSLRDAALETAEFYHDNMGYDTPEDAVDRILDMWKRRGGK